MRYAVIGIFMALAGCTSVNKNVQNVCPENSSLSCISEIRCEFDDERGCNVCYCHEAPNDPGSPSDYDKGGYDDETGGI
jgi:hypothetical protein